MARLNAMPPLVIFGAANREQQLCLRKCDLTQEAFTV